MASLQLAAYARKIGVIGEPSILYKRIIRYVCLTVFSWKEIQPDRMSTMVITLELQDSVVFQFRSTNLTNFSSNLSKQGASSSIDDLRS